MVSVTSQQEFSDADLRVVATGDQSKKLKFDLSGLTTGTTRIWTVPDANYTFPTSGTYTPTLYNTTNVAASTAYVCQYARVGDFVIVSGSVDIQATAAASTSTVLGMSLPVASAFAAYTSLAGVGFNDGNTQTARIIADETNDRVAFDYKAQTTSNRGFAFIFAYQVI